MVVADAASLALADTAAPSFPLAVAIFCETLLAKSRRTATNYVSALRRFEEFLDDVDGARLRAATDALPSDVLERFYTWLLARATALGRNDWPVSSAVTRWLRDTSATARGATSIAWSQPTTRG